MCSELLSVPLSLNVKGKCFGMHVVHRYLQDCEAYRRSAPEERNGSPRDDVLGGLRQSHRQLGNEPEEQTTLSTSFYALVQQDISKPGITE